MPRSRQALTMPTGSVSLKTGSEEASLVSGRSGSGMLDVCGGEPADSEAPSRGKQPAKLIVKQRASPISAVLFIMGFLSCHGVLFLLQCISFYGFIVGTERTVRKLRGMYINLNLKYKQ